MKYFGTVLILVACTTTFVFSNAQDSPSPAEEQPSISPDKKWGYIGGDTPKLVKLSTDETVIDFFEQLNPGRRRQVRSRNCSGRRIQNVLASITVRCTRII